MAYPKWKYRVHPELGVFQNTLVGNAQAEAELIKEGWSDDAAALGVEVVPYPAELTLAGTLIHHQTQADAEGRHPHGPAPTAPGIGGVVIGSVIGGGAKASTPKGGKQ